ncbi:hypothetical protein ICM_06214 [Bacillus cereus BAG1X2-3]|uniref:TniQ family protein n=1 Tax=Bacillus cereus TaxID=1396 RepID=UPI00032DB1BB|nr:hypothetical protein ICC_06361 [Bacillus cereus BAG1X1-1]EOO42771.1 hypothetical protein ICI_06278 [Bacillus cereus BAG1X2-1]EOO43882.1 hypothetical protein ICK_06575 [Bacillus cereus BAG1X2-2]EOO55913.1 hypothetical protein ICM_06214 [Bacillus cereus BAG1X2-3]EOO99992.1 hypothetical protein ICO_06624 [Bacillus cereus BAG2O-1]HDR4539443.1 hypothetical protein [Bacillus cereus]
MIYINQVLQYVTDSKRIRVIDIEESYVYIVNIDTTSTMPQKELYSVLQTDIKQGELLLIMDPYYTMFLIKQRQEEILRDVASNGKALYARLGMIAGSICRKTGFYYCAECTKSDVEQFGEPYIHREHHLQGMDYCPHHEVQLRKYPVDTTSRIEYIRFELKNMNLSSIYKADPFAKISIHLSKQAYKLLRLPLHKFSREDIKLKYHTLLCELSLITVSNRVRQKELYQAF